MGSSTVNHLRCFHTLCLQVCLCVCFFADQSVFVLVPPVTSNRERARVSAQDVVSRMSFDPNNSGVSSGSRSSISNSTMSSSSTTTSLSRFSHLPPSVQRVAQSIQDDVSQQLWSPPHEKPPCLSISPNSASTNVSVFDTNGPSTLLPLPALGGGTHSSQSSIPAFNNVAQSRLLPSQSSSAPPPGSNNMTAFLHNFLSEP